MVYLEREEPGGFFSQCLILQGLIDPFPVKVVISLDLFVNFKNMIDN